MHFRDGYKDLAVIRVFKFRSIAKFTQFALQPTFKIRLKYNQINDFSAFNEVLYFSSGPRNFLSSIFIMRTITETN